MEAGKVSIVVPTYNRAARLSVAIGSLQAQTYPCWEAIVVDDGSTDETRDMVRSLAASDARIKYFYQDRAGVSAARNTGMRIADGEWIAFLDSDDSWEPWKLSVHTACFKALPSVGMIWTDMDGVDSNGSLLFPAYLRKMYRAYDRVGSCPPFESHARVREIAPDLVPPCSAVADAFVHWGDAYSAMLFGNLVHTSTVLLTHERQRQVGFFNERYRTGEDYDFHLRTCSYGPVALLDVPTVRYRVAGGADQLTAPEFQVEIAMNGLRTREEAIARDRKRIALSDEVLSGIMTHARAWVAAELFEQGDFKRARSYFRQGGLLANPNLKSIAKASISHLPPSVASSVMALIRKRRKSLSKERHG